MTPVRPREFAARAPCIARSSTVFRPIPDEIILRLRNRRHKRKAAARLARTPPPDLRGWYRGGSRPGRWRTTAVAPEEGASGYPGAPWREGGGTGGGEKRERRSRHAAAHCSFPPGLCVGRTAGRTEANARIACAARPRVRTSAAPPGGGERFWSAARSRPTPRTAGAGRRCEARVGAGAPQLRTTRHLPKIIA